LRILRGEVPSSIPTKPVEASAPVYDWRELRRWGISEARLPPGSIVRFRESTFWQQYHWYVAGALAIIAIEAVLIAGLLLQRSQRRRAESELRESQEFMELSTSAGELGLWMRDLTGGDLWTNPRLRSLFGFDHNDVLRIEDVFARIHPDDRSQVVSLLQHAQEDGLPFETEFRVLNNGTERWIAAKGRSVGNAPGGAARRMGVLTEITERKKAELETQQHRDELTHVSRVSMMGQLASALAHELNQPLGAILRNAEAAELFIRASPPDLQEVCAILADIRKDDQRAGDVIDRMRALLQRREFQWSDLDLNALVEDVARLLRTDAEARRVKLTLELPLSRSSIRGDRVQLQQVMLNLILNAMDAMNGCEAGKRAVTVRVRRVAESAEVAVSDTASGIPEENLKRLFEPFFTTKPTGLGLGLAISHTIIEAHGGRLWAENNPGSGATFYFTLPVAGRDKRNSGMNE
jgi:two-component system, LuxR family, sensor kinase FixL